jgi:hypothetical protein
MHLRSLVFIYYCVIIINNTRVLVKITRSKYRVIKEEKSKVLPHFLFYQNIYLSLILHIHIHADLAVLESGT